MFCQEKPDVAEGFHQVVLDGIFRERAFFRDLMMTKPFETAQVKDLLLLGGQLVYGLFYQAYAVFGIEVPGRFPPFADCMPYFFEQPAFVGYFPEMVQRAVFYQYKNIGPDVLYFRQLCPVGPQLQEHLLHNFLCHIPALG